MFVILGFFFGRRGDKKLEDYRILNFIFVVHIYKPNSKKLQCLL